MDLRMNARRGFPHNGIRRISGDYPRSWSRCFAPERERVEVVKAVAAMGIFTPLKVERYRYNRFRSMSFFIPLK